MGAAARTGDATALPLETGRLYLAFELSLLLTAIIDRRERRRERGAE